MEMLVIAVVVVVAFTAVLLPLFRRGSPGDGREFDAGPAVPIAGDEQEAGVAAGAADEVELEVQRYRSAVRAGTVCTRCGQANPADSLFCFECGAQLQRDDAKEFE